MKERKRILHIVNSMGRGGAERVVLNNIRLFDQYDHVLCTLNKPDDLVSSLPPGVPVFNLQFGGKWDTPNAIWKYRKLLKEQRIDIVHAHLLWSSWIARLGKLNDIPLVTTIHNRLSNDAFSKNRLARRFEQMTAGKVDTMLSVSKASLDDYLEHIHYRGKTRVIYNYNNIDNIKPVQIEQHDANMIRIISVGNLRDAKNHAFLIDAVGRLDEHEKQRIQVDIYGGGDLEDELNDQIARLNAPVTLKGVVNDVAKIYGNYDVFCMPSRYEGLPMVILEASCAGLPMLLSDIPIFRELADGIAEFFELEHIEGLTARLRDIISGNINLKRMSDKSIKLYSQLNDPDKYIRDHYSVYEEALAVAH